MSKLRHDCFVSNCALVSHEYIEDYIEGFFGTDPRHLQGHLSTLKSKHLLENEARALLYTITQPARLYVWSNQNQTMITTKKDIQIPTQALKVPAKTLDWVLGLLCNKKG